MVLEEAGVCGNCWCTLPLLTSIGWANSVFSKDIQFAEFEQYTTVGDVAGLFETIDELLNEFLERFEERIDVKLHDATPLKIFTHVITHEFHHKGQVLSISRHLGYVPVDTDVMR